MGNSGLKSQPQFLKRFWVHIFLGFLAVSVLLVYFLAHGFVTSALMRGSDPGNSKLSKLAKVPRDVTLPSKTGIKSTKDLGYKPGEIIVKYKTDKINLRDNIGAAKAFVWGRLHLMDKKDEIKNQNIQVFTSDRPVENLVNKIKADPNVESVEPNYLRYPSTISTDDTYRGLLWGLDNTGQMVNGTAGTNDADIDAPSAWAISEGSPNVTVAVIDSGVGYNHPDLAGNMWDGTNCKDENGGLLGGCFHGFNYEANNKFPLPTNSEHGTHIAGTIAAIKNNTKGIIGVAPSTKIMAIKFDLTVATEIKAIDFAIQNGAKIINASYGGGTYSALEYAAINRFKNAGGIFVAAAGNWDLNNDGGTHIYPSDYDLSNIISVAATDQNDTLASFSDYGATSVDVGAPGVNIVSTIPLQTTVLDENFEELIAPTVPTGWTATDNWGTYTYPVFDGNVLYGDLNKPYLANTDSTITSTTFNLSGAGGAGLAFWAFCNTEYNPSSWTDYMALEASADGSSFNEIKRWDQPTLDSLNGISDPSGTGYYYFNLSIPNQYATANFKFRFRWVTNASDNNHDGCFVDDLLLTALDDGTSEKYEFMSGTSMAAPHVVGEAALIWAVKPSLSADQVKARILSTGDPLSSLTGKTVSGKRINAFNALNGLETIPTATDSAEVTSRDLPSVITLVGNDVDGDSLTYSIVSNVTQGSLGTVVGNQVIYTPGAGYVGPDEFSFKANDGTSDSNTATVSITVNPPLTISNINSHATGSSDVIVTWVTDYPSTSRTVYDTASHSAVSAAPNYGYANSTAESDTSSKVTSHSVHVTGLSSKTIYYYRVIGYGSPEIVGEEFSFTTTFSTGSNNNSNSGTNSSGPPGPPGCNDQKPSSVPDLFQINVTGSTAKLFFTPIGNSSQFFISFSTKPGAEEHGEMVTLSSWGVQSETVFLLKSKTTYYFKVRGQNGCNPGNWSNILKAVTKSQGTTTSTPVYRYNSSKRA